MKIIAILLFVVPSYTHDIQVSFYKIYLSDQEPRIEFVFEQADILQALENTSDELTDDLIQDYLTNNFYIYINEIPSDISLEIMRISNKHIYLVGNLQRIDAVIETVDINNTCLTNIQDHSNIIEVHLDESQRDFLMNSDRTSISINY